MKLFTSPVFVFLSLAPIAQAAVSVSDPSLTWTPLLGNYDYLVDQQTGQPSSDIVGSGTDYGLFVTFNDNGSTSATDGIMGFRLRLDDAGVGDAFTHSAWIGIDADINGSVDVFLGLNLSGSSSEVGVFSPGTNSNTSPSTTSIGSSPYSSYLLAPDNYNYRQVNLTIDGGTTNDVTPNAPKDKADPDYYVSFMVPFADVAAFLSTKSINITDQSPLRYVSATATQGNSLNQDLGGVDGGVNSTTTWTDLGGFTSTVTANGTVIPEPSSGLLALVAISAACSIRRRR